MPAGRGPSGRSDRHGPARGSAPHAPSRDGQARKRAQFDLAQAVARSVSYSFEAPAEAIVCRRGSLIGVQHYSLDSTSASGRVVAVDGLSLRLDEAVPAGTGRAAAIRSGGLVTVMPIEDGADSDTITLAEPGGKGT